MQISSSSSRLVLAFSLVICLSASMAAQRSGKSGGTGSRPGPSTSIPSINNPQPTTTQPLFITGKVLVEGEGAPTEPVIIERVCNGVARRQGYTDVKGTFQFQLDQNVGFQDASENLTGIFETNPPTNSQAVDAMKLKYQGCEIRAVLSGFLSSAAPLRLQGSTWQYDLGTIFLKRTEGVTGTTISASSYAAPGEARHDYEKGRKDFDKGKFPDAEKELSKAVKIYPGFAAAWSLLGDIHQQQKRLDQATREYRQALAADPHFVNPSFGLALIAVQEKRWQDAVQLTDQVTKMNAAAFPSAFFYNAVANYNLARLEPAIESARRFKTLDTEHRHPDVCLLLGQIFIHKRDYASAAQEMRDYLALAPSAANAEEARQTLKRLEEAMVAQKK
jgi:tetratricopeptide (TPR) repeat protein